MQIDNRKVKQHVFLVTEIVQIALLASCFLTDLIEQQFGVWFLPSAESLLWSRGSVGSRPWCRAWAQS